MSDAPAPAAVPPKKGKKTLLIIFIILMVGVGGAGAGAFFYLRRAPAAVSDVKAKPKASERGLIAFEPFVANLADPGGTRYVRATIQLVVDKQAAAEEVQKAPVALMQTRSQILELLTQQTAATIVTPEGKAGVKKLIAERVAESLEDVKVIDVLFSDFVVQF
jgi:flagellar protein FliL